MSRFRVLLKKESNGEAMEWKDMLWCDYVGCVNYSSRLGIQNRNHLVVEAENAHFCSYSCKVKAEAWDKKVKEEKEANEKKPLAEE